MEGCGPVAPSPQPLLPGARCPPVDVTELGFPSQPHKTLRGEGEPEAVGEVLEGGSHQAGAQTPGGGQLVLQEQVGPLKPSFCGWV